MNDSALQSHGSREGSSNTKPNQEMFKASVMNWTITPASVTLTLLPDG